MYTSLLARRIPQLLASTAFLIALGAPGATRAQDKPYFVTYSQDLEEPGNLEFENKSALGKPEGETTSARSQQNWSTERRPGGRPSSTWMGRLHRMSQPYRPVSAGRIVFGC